MPRGKGVTPQHEKKRVDIMLKAMKLFMSKGFDGTSTSDICWSARLTKPSLYHYFNSKNHLLFSIHMYAIENLLRPYLAEAATIKDPLERLRMMIRGYTKIILSHPELRFLLHESLTVKDKYYMEIRKEWRRLHILYRTTIVELQSAGTVAKNLEPSWSSLLLLGMISWMTFWFNYKNRERVDEVVDLVVRMGFQSLGIAPAAESAPAGGRDADAEKVSAGQK
jgi:AcrR family transcriptional regulator